jgi:G:T-mismatch repair DNA endonuclease (very short patch repair protein)
MYKDENGKWHHTQEENDRSGAKVGVAQTGKSRKFSEKRNAKISAAQKRNWEDSYDQMYTRFANPSEKQKEQIKNAQEKGTEAAARKSLGTKNLALSAYYAAMTPEEKRAFFANWNEAGRKAATEAISSRLEDAIALLLEEQKIVYVRHKWFYINERRYCVDFAYEGKHIIEVNGCYWHQCEQCGRNEGIRGVPAETIRALDTQRKADLESIGYTVEIIWEHQLNNKKGAGFEREERA